MTAPITLPPLDEQSLSDLRHRYDEASDAETRTRYQMLWLSAKGQTSTQIATLVRRSQDTVVRVMIGKFPVGVYDPLVFAQNLQHEVGPWLKVQSASMRTELTSWNHAKVIDVDGRAAIVGGAGTGGPEAPPFL